MQRQLAVTGPPPVPPVQQRDAEAAPPVWQPAARHHWLEECPAPGGQASPTMCCWPPQHSLAARGPLSPLPPAARRLPAPLAPPPAVWGAPWPLQPQPATRRTCSAGAAAAAMGCSEHSRVGLSSSSSAGDDVSHSYHLPTDETLRREHDTARKPPVHAGLLRAADLSREIPQGIAMTTRVKTRQICTGEHQIRALRFTNVVPGDATFRALHPPGPSTIRGD